MSGHDPLPAYLKNARLDIGTNTATATATATANANANKMTDTPPEEQSLVSVSKISVASTDNSRPDSG